MEYLSVGDKHFNQTIVHTIFNDTSRIFAYDIIQLAWVRGILIAIYSVLCAIGAFVNGLVLYYLCRYRHHSQLKSMRYLIMNLALCDFFKLTVYEPLRSVEIFLPFSTGEPVTTQFYCQVCSFLGYTHFTAGYHTMVAISVERYLVICYPLRSKSWVSVGSTLKIIAIIWIIAVSSMLPVPLKYSNISHIMLADGTRVDFCMSEVFGNDGHVPLSWKVYLICMLIIYYVIPVLSMTYFYSVIFQTLNKNLHILRVNDPGLCKVLEGRKSLSKRLLMVAVIFTLLHTPYFMIVSCISFGAPLPKNPVLSLILIEILLTMNSMLHPFIYCAQSHSFFRRRMFGLFNTLPSEGTSKSIRKQRQTSSQRTWHRAENNSDTAFHISQQHDETILFGKIQLNNTINFRMKNMDHNCLRTKPYTLSDGQDPWTKTEAGTIGSKV